MKKLRVVFVVQGEGRGHMTQAIALQEILKQDGHNVVGVLVGTSKQRDVPQFFHNRMDAEVTQFVSPNFVIDKRGKGVRAVSTVVQNIMMLPTFVKKLSLIQSKIEAYQPDLVVNFYDPLVGLYYLRHRPSIPLLCLANQYLFHHRDFSFPDNKLLDVFAARIFTDVTAIRASKKLALSFQKLKKDAASGVEVVPPLLREDVFELKPTNGEHFLAYILNKGYADELIRWHERHPEEKIHCFWDNAEKGEVYEYSKNLHFHMLNDVKFLEYMASSKGVISTAGFEAMSEAMYLGKPIFSMPVHGHIEQQCNAQRIATIGAGIEGTSFDLDPFLEFLPKYSFDTKGFRQWVDTGPELYMKKITEIMSS